MQNITARGTDNTFTLINPVWKTITLGLKNNPKSPEEYRQALLEKKFSFADHDWDILRQVRVSFEEVELNLAIVSVKYLVPRRKNERFALYSEICHELCYGYYRKCPSEVGPAVRLAYGDQPKGECLNIAMNHIRSRDGIHCNFVLDSDDEGRWLRRGFAYRDATFMADELFVVVRPR